MTDEANGRPNGIPCWVDLGVPDVEAAKAFYGALFGWGFEASASAADAYTMCTLGGRPVAALGRASAGSFWWNVYFAAHDVDATAKRIADGGGTLVDLPQDLQGGVRVAIAKDPAGAQFGLLQGDAGIVGAGEPGTPAWYEYRTPDTEAARAFYAPVLDRPVESMGVPGFDYLTLLSGQESLAGFWGAPDARPRWTTYFAVSDADEAAGRTAELGGTLESGPQDSYYGRVAWIKDPFGTELALIARSADADG